MKCPAGGQPGLVVPGFAQNILENASFDALDAVIQITAFWWFDEELSEELGQASLEKPLQDAKAISDRPANE